MLMFDYANVHHFWKRLEVILKVMPHEDLATYNQYSCCVRSVSFYHFNLVYVIFYMTVK